MSKTKKRRKRKTKQIKIPPKIKEIISYLAHTFTSKVLERDDLVQDLYLAYVKTIRKSPKYTNLKMFRPGWWFIKFKRILLTKYAKEVKRIKKEWDFRLQNSPKKSEIQSRIGYLNDLEYDNQD
jgi:hypothetical protein